MALVTFGVMIAYKLITRKVGQIQNLGPIIGSVVPGQSYGFIPD